MGGGGGGGKGGWGGGGKLACLLWTGGFRKRDGKNPVVHYSLEECLGSSRKRLRKQGSTDGKASNRPTWGFYLECDYTLYEKQS